MDVLKNRLSGCHGGKILDVATGRGSFARIMMDSFAGFDEIIAIDNGDPTRLTDAQKSFGNERITFKPMNGEKLDFENDSFNTVSISNSLHHMGQLDKVLSEMLRVLKPGGLFIINEMIRDNQTEPQLTHVYMHHWWARIDTGLGISHNETLTRKEIIDIAGRLGLKALEYFEHIDAVADVKDPEELREMNKVIDDYCEKAKNLPDYPSLKLQGEDFRKRLRDVGIAGATQVIVIGRK